jgi:hypothetical protein
MAELSAEHPDEQQQEDDRHPDEQQRHRGVTPETPQIAAEQGG